VGIGTTSPECELHVEGNYPEIRIDSTANTIYSMLSFYDTSGHLGNIVQYDSSHATRANDMRFLVPVGGDFEFNTGNVAVMAFREVPSQFQRLWAIKRDKSLQVWTIKGDGFN